VSSSVAPPGLDCGAAGVPGLAKPRPGLPSRAPPGLDAATNSLSHGANCGSESTAWVPCFRGARCETAKRPRHRESMPSLQAPHAFDVLMQGSPSLQILGESMAHMPPVGRG